MCVCERERERDDGEREGARGVLGRGGGREGERAYLGMAEKRREALQMKGPPSKLQMGPQKAVAGGGTSKSGGDTGKAIRAILSLILTQVFQVLATPSCIRRPHPPLSHCIYFLISGFVD